jgi:hypothetical protein
MMEKTNWFAIRIVICNAIGYCISVGIPTFLDPQIHHPIYGLREYPLGGWILLGALIVCISTYIIILYELDLRLKSVLVGLSLIIITWMTLPNFRPEWPHLGVLLTPISFAVLTSISVFIHFYEIDFEFINDPLVIKEAKIEGLKLEYETWFRLFLGILAGFFLIGGSFYSLLPKYVEIFTSLKSEQFIYQGFTAVSFVSILIIFLSTLCFELLQKILIIKNKLQNLSKTKCIRMGQLNWEQKSR